MGASAIFAALQLATASASPNAVQYESTDRVVVDPSYGYVVIRSGYTDGIRLLRKADETDRRSWEAARQVAYEKARKSYERKLKTYEQDIKAWTSGSSFDRRMIGSRPTKPVEVTLDNAPVEPIETRLFTGATSKPAIEGFAGGVQTYLLRLRPGTYYFYGVSGYGIGQGTCFCMGTLGFSVQAGQVVDVGGVRPAGASYFESPIYLPPSTTPAISSVLSGRQIVPAQVFAVGKIANSTATPITRVAPVVGVLAYDRDIPLDAANGNRPVPAVR